MFELTITIKGVESTYKHKFLVHEDCQFNQDDETIKAHIAEALAMSKIEPEKIMLTAKFEVV